MCLFLHIALCGSCTYHNTCSSSVEDVRETQQGSIWIAQPLVLCYSSTVTYHSGIVQMYWKCHWNSISWQLFFKHIFSIQPAWNTSIYFLLYYYSNKKTKIHEHLFVWQRIECLIRKKGGKKGIGMHSGLCVSLCESHTTVPYIKLSAPQLSSSSKWSLMAWGGFVSWLWIKSWECPKP